MKSSQVIPSAEVERMMKLQDVLLKAMAKRISWLSAAEIIGVTPRTMRRWRERLEEQGYDGLRDRRKGKTSQRRVALETCEAVLRLYQEKYFAPSSQVSRLAKVIGARESSKTTKILDLLKRPGGATSKELIKATGWLPHSVRGFLAGTLGKKMGLTVISTKGQEGERTYAVGAVGHVVQPRCVGEQWGKSCGNEIEIKIHNQTVIRGNRGQLLKQQFQGKLQVSRQCVGCATHHSEGRRAKLVSRHLEVRGVGNVKRLGPELQFHPLP